MSAINDALRRASTAAKTNPGAPVAPPPPPTPPAPSMVSMSAATLSPPPSGAALPPIITVPPGLAPSLPSEKKRSKAPMVLTILFLFLVVGAGAAYFFGKKYFIAQARERLQRAQEEMSTNNEELAALFAEAKAAAAGPATNGAPHDPSPVKVQPVVAVRPPDPAPRQTPSAVTPAPVPQAPIAPRAPVHFPPLRLQSIFYRPANPCVMINGKTLFVEDEINGVIVADIQPASVTLVLGGQTNILTLR